MRRNNVTLRLQTSFMKEAKRVAETEVLHKKGVALNQFINVAVAEKLSALALKIIFESGLVAQTLRRQSES